MGSRHVGRMGALPCIGAYLGKRIRGQAAYAYVLLVDAFV